MLLDRILTDGGAGCRYYLNGADAFRLKLLLPLYEDRAENAAAQELAGLAVTHAPGTPVLCQ